MLSDHLSIALKIYQPLFGLQKQQDCSYQGKTLNVSTAF